MEIITMCYRVSYPSSNTCILSKSEKKGYKKTNKAKEQSMLKRRVESE